MKQIKFNAQTKETTVIDSTEIQNPQIEQTKSIEKQVAEIANQLMLAQEALDFLIMGNI